MPHRRRARNAIGAPLPAHAVTPVFDRLNQRLERHAQIVAVARMLLVSFTVLLLAADQDAHPAATVCVAGYAVLLLVIRHRHSPTVQRLILVTDVLFVPIIVLATQPTATSTHVVTLIVGLWIVLCALDGNPRRTRIRIAALIALTIVSTTTFGATLGDIAITAAFIILAHKAAAVQQVRLLGRTITSVEHIQRALALRPTQVDASPPTS